MNVVIMTSLMIFIERKLTSVNCDEISILRGNYIKYRVENPSHSHPVFMLDTSFYTSIKHWDGHKTHLKITKNRTVKQSHIMPITLVENGHRLSDK